MQIKPFGLAVELVPAQFEPFQTFVDRIQRGLRVPLDIGIVDAEHDHAAPVAGMKPIEQKCSSAPDMKVASGRGRKADTCHTQNIQE
jgi:hypothetical protein